jgi:hypothetical protein
MIDLTYKDKVVGTIRIARKEDCLVIGTNVRKQDALEIWNYDRTLPHQAVLNSFNNSTVVMTVENRGKQVAMFGIMILVGVPTLWMFSTDDLNQIGRNFLKNTREWINKMLEEYPVLIAYADMRNKESRRWLDFVGGNWDGKVKMGVDMMEFQKYRFEREVCKN